jgi:hypothetical protein
MQRRELIFNKQFFPQACGIPLEAGQFSKNIQKTIFKELQLFDH